MTRPAAAAIAALALFATGTAIAAIAGTAVIVYVPYAAVGAIGWALVTGILVALFAGLVVGLQALLAALTEESTLAVAASTLVAFALFQPLRRRVQRAVDRRFDRARYDGQRTVDAFAGRLRGQVDLTDLERDVASTVRAALSPTSAAMWIRGREVFP